MKVKLEAEEVAALKAVRYAFTALKNKMQDAKQLGLTVSIGQDEDRMPTIEGVMCEHSLSIEDVAEAARND